MDQVSDDKMIKVLSIWPIIIYKESFETYKHYAIFSRNKVKLKNQWTKVQEDFRTLFYRTAPNETSKSYTVNNTPKLSNRLNRGNY